MMATNDVRREVASALRGDPNDTFIPQSRDGFEGMTYREAAYRFWNMCHRVRSAANVDIAYSTTSVLADFIDLPTCKNVSGYQDVFECSECGCEVELITGVCNEYCEQFSVTFIPSFCPECGAEVMDE